MLVGREMQLSHEAFFLIWGTTCNVIGIREVGPARPLVTHPCCNTSRSKMFADVMRRHHITLRNWAAHMGECL
jgi:hypothetical protein